MKIRFFDRRVIKTFSIIATWTLAVSSLAISIILSLLDVSLIWGVGIVGILIVIHILIYTGVWCHCKKKNSVTIKIRGTTINIREGDIFEEKCKKVIAWNEFFDTQVDDIIIAKGSLHGTFINTYIQDIPALDKHIEEYLSCSKQTMTNRPVGKKIRYELGTIVPYGDYLFLAYSRFDKNNAAFLEKEDVAKVYMKMWDEIDRYKAHDSISMPVLGSSKIVRGVNYTPQQWVELILWSFNTSGVNMTRLASINIIIHPTMTKEINFLKLAEFSD